jgi:gluconolactonase
MFDFEVICDGLRFPEAPIYCEDGSVIVGELRGACVTRVRPDGSKHLVAKIQGEPNGLAFGSDGALYCCNNGGSTWEDGNPYPVGPAANYTRGSIERIDVHTGKVERLYDSCDGIPLAAPNDIVFDRNGNFWFTDLGKDLGTYQTHGGLFYASVDGLSIQRVVGGIGLNGVGLSPDGKTVYAAATFLRWVLAYDTSIDRSEKNYGFLSGRIVMDYPRRSLLDSMAIEADGTIAQAVVVENYGISRVDLSSGVGTTLSFPDPLTTNIAFGGTDMLTAFVTLSVTGQLVKGRWPAPGLRLAYNF